eukprot:Nitzschia sp. Nitz4//scaffold107_size73032//48518//50482//NITZ4_005765-RA/size73032-processed-gene-0.128-mRNA-1//-1//CDS//3329532608//3660//frame0
MPNMNVSTRRHPRLSNPKAHTGSEPTYDMDDEDYTSHASSYPPEDDHPSLEKKSHHGLPSNELSPKQSMPSALDTSHSDSHGISNDSDSLDISLSNSEGNGEVSYSDSDGSTYVSDEEYQQQQKSRRSVPPEAMKKSVAPKSVPPPSTGKPPVSPKRVNQVTPPTNSFVNIDLNEEDIPVPTGTHAKRKTQARSPNRVRFPEPLTKKELTPRKKKPVLQNVDYYSDVDVASHSDDVSEIGFISKDDTREVFLVRTIPMEVPISHAHDLDLVSSASSSVDGSFTPSISRLSIGAAFTKRGMSPNVQLEGIHNVQLRKSKGETTISPVNLVFEVPASFSSGFSAMSSTSHVQTTKDHGMITHVNSDEAVRDMDSPTSSPTSTPKAPEYSTSTSIEKVVQSVDENKVSLPPQKKPVRSTEDDESSTDRRIRELKEKIRSMQVTSTMEILSDEFRHKSKEQEKKESKEVVQDVVQEDLPSSKKRSTRVKLEHGSSWKKLEKKVTDLEETSSVIEDGIHAESSEEATAGFNHRKGAIPSEIATSNRDDDISTIFCEVKHDNMDDVDLESGMACEHYQPKTTKERVVQLSTKLSRLTQRSLRKTDQHLQQYAVYVQIRQYLVAQWMTHMHHRTSSEKAIAATICLSSLVLVILFISMIAG